MIENYKQNQKKTLIFPELGSKLENAISLKELKKELRRQYKDHEQKENKLESFPFTFSTNENKEEIYINAKCKLCKCFLQWVGTELNGFKLKKYKIKHLHHGGKLKCQKGRKEEIFSFLGQLGKQLDLTSAWKLIIEHFNVKENYAKMLVKQWCLSWGSTMRELSEKFYENKINCLYHPFDSESIPDVTVIVTKEMKELFLKFGNVIKIDFTYNVIQRSIKKEQNEEDNLKEENLSESYESSSNEMKETDNQSANKKKMKILRYPIGLISGFNSFHKTIVYGISIINAETKESISKILQLFFQIMGSTCKYIISDESKGIECGIVHLNEFFLKNKVIHLLDSFHILKKMKLTKYEYTDMLSELIRSKSKAKYKEILEKLKSRMNEYDKQELKKIEYLSERFIISQIPCENFLGISSSTSSCESLNNIVKNKIKFTVSFWEFIPRIINICSNFNYINSERLEISSDFISDHSLKGLKNVQKYLPKRVFETLIETLSETRRVDMIQQNQKSIILSENGQNVTMSKSEDGKWICECNFSKLTDLPCIHQLKVIDDVTAYIGPFWKQNENSSAVEKESLKRRVTHRKKRF